LKKNHLLLVIIVIIGLFVAWLINMDYIRLGEKTIEKNTALMRDGNACVAIAEKSVAHMVVVVEFQKLEIIGRKARVMRNCMDDHGYIQNPAWTSYATPIAQATAKSQQISFNEAFENLRRQDMVIFQSWEKIPFYWAPKSK